MCRSIKLLRAGQAPAPAGEIQAAALQFVRKISGFRAPAPHNAEAFERAVQEIAASSEALLNDLVVRASRPAPNPKTVRPSRQRFVSKPD